MTSFKDVFGTVPKVLWIASSGGHVAQAHRIEKILGPNPASRWVTFDVPQTRSLLEGRQVDYVDYVAPRDFRGAWRAARRIRKIAKQDRFDFVISTGSAIAFFALPLLALVDHLPVFYVESLARSTGPSLTGRLMRLAPRVRTFTQYESWSTGAWRYTGTILDSFRRIEARPVASSTGRRVFVTLGTIRPYRFDRLVDAVLAITNEDDDLVWQLGVTTRSDLPGRVYESLSGADMERHFAEADVVITHSGVGSLLAAFEQGKMPILAVRDDAHSEHVDDHQKYIADVATSRGIALRMDLDAPSRAVMDSAVRARIVGELNV